jgi:hypothetical protein
MKIGILGSGIVGQTLALGFEKYKYEVMIGSRSVQKLEEWKKSSGFKGLTGDFAGTANFADLIVLAIKGSAAEEAFRMTGMASHSGKIVIDTTNPIADTPPANGVLQFNTHQNSSLMEQLQHAFPHAHFVKAFSCIGAPHMVNPKFSEKPSMFICGNDADARNTVTQIVTQFGFVPEDMGTAEAARAIEPLCILWCIPGMRENKWNHAFRLVKA